MSTSLAHLDTERRYWYSRLKPICEKNGLWWDVLMDTNEGTVTIKLVHPNDVSAAKSVYKNMDKSLISLIDADRKNRSEEKIMEEIDREIKARIANR